MKIHRSRMTRVTRKALTAMTKDEVFAETMQNWFEAAQSFTTCAADNLRLGNRSSALKDIRTVRRYLTLAEQTLRLHS
jgi:hypothetical protein